MFKNNLTLDSVTAALTAAGLASFLSQPLWIHGPSVLKSFATGKIQLVSAGQISSRSDHPAIVALAEEANGLKLLTAAPGNIVAIQPVNGVIYGGVSAGEEFFYDLFNLDRIHHAVARVASDSTIKTLVLRMNTPGGSVAGLHAAAAALQGLAAARPDLTLVSYAQTLCASAGMYLAAATSEFHAAPGAWIGSIGTIASLSDWSGFKEKIGLETRTYTADSKLKNFGGSPITEDHDKYMTDIVNQYSAEFKGWMAERRGLAAADMHGQCWEARLAPEGMCDSAFFPTFEQFLAAGLL